MFLEECVKFFDLVLGRLGIKYGSGALDIGRVGEWAFLLVP